MEIVPFVSQVLGYGMDYQSRLGNHCLLKILNSVLRHLFRVAFPVKETIAPSSFYLVAQRLRMAPASKVALLILHYYYLLLLLKICFVYLRYYIYFCDKCKLGIVCR